MSSVDKVDLLFMVDNSSSMTSKQNSLKAQFPHMIQVLSTGMRTANDPNPFPPVKDMHLAVVSSDMGAVGQAGVMGCDPNGGDDGRLKHVSSGDPGCQATYPPFLTYNATVNDPQQIGVDFACIASLGVEGCTYENQLESPLKALWPSLYVGANGSIVTPNPYMFLATTPQQTLGRGDLPPPEGAMGFMRTDITSPSVLGIILLTDEDDQSSKDTAYLGITDMNNPISRQPVQTRPFLNQGNLYDTDRYVKGFKALRPGLEDLVVFAAIAGVPTDLVDAKARANVDFTDEAQRDAYYRRIENDPRMQQRVVGGGAGEALNTACTRRNSMGQIEGAVPTRRILKVVEGFGENGTFQSICADDYGTGMDAIIEIIARQLGAVCLPRPLVRNNEGLVACKVVWELLPPSLAAPGSLTSCEMAPYLKPVGTGRLATNERGGVNCEVEQLPVTTPNAAPGGLGWFYDTFSTGVMQSCPQNRQQRVTFTDTAKPPSGVTVKLECLNEVQTLPLPRKDLSTTQQQQPQIGSACGSVTLSNGKMLSGDAACAVQLNNGSTDTSMFCHPQLNVCVQRCTTATDCPPAWECDTREETTTAAKGKAYCVNPTCGVDL